MAGPFELAYGPMHRHPVERLGGRQPDRAVLAEVGEGLFSLRTMGERASAGLALSISWNSIMSDLPRERNHPVGTALARSTEIRGGLADVVTDVGSDVSKVSADHAAILFALSAGRGFQFQGSSS